MADVVLAGLGFVFLLFGLIHLCDLVGRWAARTQGRLWD